MSGGPRGAFTRICYFRRLDETCLFASPGRIRTGWLRARRWCDIWMVHGLLRPRLFHLTHPSLEHAHRNHGRNILQQQRDQAQDDHPVTSEIRPQQLVERSNKRQDESGLLDHSILERRRRRRGWRCYTGFDITGLINQWNCTWLHRSFNFQP